MICYKKSLIFKETYNVELHSNKIVLQNIKCQITHILELEQDSVVDWKLDKKNCNVLALGIQIDNKWEYFYMKQQNLTLLKDFLDGKVQYHDIFKFYQIVGFLGKGAFGKVFKCQHICNGRIVACKSLKRSSKYNEKDFVNEVQCMQNLKHPNLVQLKEFCREEHCFYILMEYVEGWTLKNLIKRDSLDEKEKMIIVQVQFHQISIVIERIFQVQLLSVANYFHSEGYIYRDFKPENILFMENKVNKLKLIDFGLAIRIDEIVRNKYQVCGTLGYIAPEVFQRTYIYDFKSDIFSLGAVIYELFSGIYLVQNTDSMELQSMSKKFQFNTEMLQNIKNQTIRKLLYGMLQEDPILRIDSRQAIDIFRQANTNDGELLTTDAD